MSTDEQVSEQARVIQPVAWHEMTDEHGLFLKANRNQIIDVLTAWNQDRFASMYLHDQIAPFLVGAAFRSDQEADDE